MLLIIFNLLFQDSIIHSICSTHDIDFFCHMNNAKYFKELDFARFDFYFRSGLSDYVEARKVWQSRLWSFQGRNTKLDRFLAAFKWNYQILRIGVIRRCQKVYFLKWCSIFDSSPLLQFSKFGNFIWIQLIFSPKPF